MAQSPLFEEVFNRASIYEMLFFNIKSVLQYPTLKELEANNKPMHERWKYLADTKYNNIPAGQLVDMVEYSQKIYEKNAPYYPEYCKIIAITYATLYPDNGQIRREFKKILNNDERLVIETFMDELQLISSAATKLSPPYFPPLCGHNIISHDIPLLVKRFIKNKDKIERNKELPLILKRCLNIKPWESGIIDTINVWKFNGYENTPLMLICDYLGLKKTVDLLPLDELSKYYWNNINEKPKETMEFVGLQSATQTNLVIQLMNELRQL